MYTSCRSFFALEVSAASCEVIGLPLTTCSVDSEAEGVSSSESSSLASLPSLSSLPAPSLEATVVTGTTGLEAGGSWR